MEEEEEEEEEEQEYAYLTVEPVIWVPKSELVFGNLVI